MPGQSQFTEVGTSDANGNVTITFPPGTVSAVFTGVISVPAAAAGVTWNIFLNDVQVATRTGSSEYGPLQVSATDVLKLTSTSASASTQYRAVLRGSLDLSGAAPQQIVPTVNSVTAVTQSSPPIGLYGPTTLTGSAFSTGVFPVPNQVRTLLIYVTPGFAADLTEVDVIGGTTGMYYRAQPPYLYDSIGGVYLVVCPFPAEVEGYAIVNFQSVPSRSYSVEIVGDPLEYTESIFYNGTLQVVQVIGITGTVVLNGPARIFGITMQSSGTGGGDIFVNGHILIGTTAATSTPIIQPMPADTLLPQGQAITATNCTAVVTYAYP